ncbi:CPBP family intramembrane glutamic endopeptidase [Catenibacillus scindens]|nr:CPBP family intramembrane glutamic endopeptidase [Catenibacillus scindens]
MSPGRRLWRLFSPILLYYGIVILISLMGSFIVTYQMAGEMAAMTMEEFTQDLMVRSLEATVPIYFASGLIALIPLALMMRSDRRGHMYVGDVRGKNIGALAYCLIAGILSSLAVSIFVTISQAGQVFDGYAEATGEILSQSLIMQVLSAGIVMPVVEEMIFRGLMYSRMKDFMTPRGALLLSSLIFGVYHGNVIQGIYGVVMGLLLVFVYEKYQTLAAPVLCHIGANAVSIVLQLLNVQIGSAVWAVLGAVICLLLLYLILRQIQKRVHVDMIQNPDYRPL